MSNIIVRNATRGVDLVWRNIKITKSLDEICHTLDVELSPTEFSKVRRHDKIEVRYANPLVRDSGGERRVTTVRVDEITAVVDKSKHNIKVIGRSPARDIIDSTWSGMLAEMTLRDVVREIGKDFGITCDTFPTDKPDSSGTVHDFTWNDESPWAKIVTEADTQHFIFTSNEAGNLYLWKVNTSLRDEGFHVTEGVNMISAEWKENGAEQFNTYIVTGGGETSGEVIDSTCPGKRVLTINVPDPLVSQAELAARAETELRRRRETETIVVVPGWGLTDAQIKKLHPITKGKEVFWVPNILIPVTIPSLGLKRNLLISAVQQEATHESLSTTLTLVNREKYL